MEGGPFIIGIGGGTGAGKTTIANELAEGVTAEIQVLSLDNYYRDRSHLPPEERENINYDHPDAIDWDMFIASMKALNEGKTIEVPQYDYETHTRKSSIRVTPTPVMILEGIFTLYDDQVIRQLDLPIYVQTDPDIRVLRRLRRDVIERGRNLEGVIDQYLSTVKPMHEKFVEPTKRNADIIIPEGRNESALELLQDKVNAELDYANVEVS